ncbi:nitroreductase family protein [Anaerocolumna xylanovorans]|uniref:nitroreductase family protein n=1 Tax=Anaerocolumna xylanovorans TaxID=100134 RepID=UPI001A9B984D|nr:nitroreductase family protein [Anaerocolumna xylanovorans]
MKVISRRRSIRSYQTEQIKDEELHEVLEAALLAPSAANVQKWHFAVIQEKDLLDRMVIDIIEAVRNSGNKFLTDVVSRPDHHTFYHAPTVVIISGDKSSPYSQNDCSAAAENILIAAESLNIGSCWIGTFLPLFASEKGEEYKKKLVIPEDYYPVCAVALGYKAIDNVPTPPRKKDVISFVKKG